MTEPKRYYWLKLKDDFFTSKEIKQLRKLAGGDTFTIIYLKMLLRSISEDGKLYFEGIEDNFAAEVALDIDEEVENVKLTIAFLMAKGILVQCNEAEWEVLTAKELTGSEGESASRMRRLRNRKALVSGNKPALASQCDGAVTQSDTEIEKELEKEKEKRVRFIPPTAEQVKAYADEKGYSPKEINPERFVDYYIQNGWMAGKNKMKDWQAAVRNWVRRYRDAHPEEQPKSDEPWWKSKPWWEWPIEEQRKLEQQVEERERAERERNGG
jgi:predicted phage replisome organizer